MPRRAPTIEVLARAVASGATLPDAVTQTGVSQRVATRHQAKILARAAEYRAEAARDALGVLSGGLTEAVAALRGILADKKATAAGRLRAANSLLQQYQAMKNHVELEGRIAELERHVTSGRP